MMPGFNANDFLVEFSNDSVQKRLAAVSAMLGAVGSDDLPAYRNGAYTFLANSPSTWSLPVWAFNIVLTPKGHLVNTLNGGQQFDVMIDPPGQVPEGCTNPVPGIRNITDPNGR